MPQERLNIFSKNNTDPENFDMSRCALIWTSGIAVNLLVYFLTVLELGMPAYIGATIAFLPSFALVYLPTIRLTADSKLDAHRFFGLGQTWFSIVLGLVSLSLNLALLSAVTHLYGVDFMLIGQVLGIVCGAGIGVLCLKSDRRCSIAFEWTEIKIGGLFFFLFCLGGLLFASGYHACLNYFGAHFPWNTFLFFPEYRFSDWHYSIAQASARNPYTYSGPSFATYFPISYLILRVGMVCSETCSLLVYFAISISLIGTGVYAASKLNANSRSSSRDFYFLFLGVLTSYPVIFAWDRGNIDVWIGFMCAIFSMTVQSRYKALGFIFLCLAISMKGYPAIFLLVYLYKRKWLAAIACLLTSLGISTLTMAIAWDGFAVNAYWLIENLNKFHIRYVLGAGSLFGSSDPYNAMRLLFQIYRKSVLFMFQVAPTQGGLEQFSAGLLGWYKYFSFALLAICSCFALVSNALEWKKVLAVCLSAILFPAVANDYKLCMLFPALFFLIGENRQLKSEKVIFLLLCFLMIPKSYFFIDDRPISMLINPVLLMLLVIKTVGDRNDWRDSITYVKSKIRLFKASQGALY